MPRRLIALAALCLPAAALIGVLAPFANVDPADGFTFSNSPFTDEAWWLANARNLALFGDWSTDDWNLHLVSAVYSGLQAAAFMVAGVDIITARLVVIAAVALTCLALAFGLRGPFGRGPALVAAAGYGFSPLVLYYGRLAYVEPVVALFLTVGALLVLRADGSRGWRWGLLAGGFMALAIGAKPTAIPLVMGILGGLILLDARTSTGARKWALAAGTTVLVAAGLWTVLVIIPQRDAVGIVLRILAEVTLPDEPGELVYRVLTYPLSNDRALLYTLPLVVIALAGALLAWSQRHRLPLPSRRLLAVAAGWLAVGLFVRLVIPYRPNRYFVPLVPALAILGAAALHLWSGRAASIGTRLRSPVVTITVALTILTLPGLALHASWMWNGIRELGPLQQQVAETIPPGQVVEGSYAPLFAFRAPVVAIVSRPEAAVNATDLYATRGVRWLVVEPGVEPAWAAEHRAAWAARQTVLCHNWGRAELCLVHVP